MAAERQEDPVDLAVDPLLGQPRMVADPRLSITQAAVVLGKGSAQVRRLIGLGRLPRHGPRNNHYLLLLSEVVALRDKGDPIKFVPAARQPGSPAARQPGSPAARRLGCSVDVVRQLIADGRLPLVPGTKTLVYPADVQTVAETMSDSLPRKPQVPDGYIGTAAAAKRLGLSVSYVRQMAADDRLGAVLVSGRWYCDPDRVGMVERIRHAQAVRGIPFLRFE